jgi:hypothetical protein
MGVYSPEELQFWKRKGCTVFFGASDGAILFGAARTWVQTVKAGA